MATFQPLLITQLVNRLPPQASSAQDAYLAILRLMRRFSGASIVEEALRMLWHSYPGRFDELQMAPWHVLLLVKWALRDPHVALRTGPNIPSEAFHELRQRVLDLVGLEHRLNPPENLHLMVRTHFQQIEFQRPEGWGFLRWPALIARQPASHPSHRQALDELRLPMDHLIDLSYALFAPVVNRELPLAPGYLEPLRATYGSSIDSFWELIARDLPSLREELRRAHGRRELAKQELYEFPYLKRFPMVRLRDGRIHCWHPLVFARGLEELVHLRLSELRTEYTEPFSRLFEKYVVELTKAMAPSALSDEEYLHAIGGSASNVEAAIACGDCNVFVEAKMSLFADDVVLTDSQDQAYLKTKRLRDGIKQAWAVGRKLRSTPSPLPDFVAAEQDFLLLVTSRELYVGDGEMLKRLYRPDKLRYPDDATEARLPLRNVFIVSIEDFERLSCAVAAGEVSLPSMLKEAASKNQDPATSSMLFDGYLQPHITRWGLPDLLLSARRDAESRLAVAFGESPDRFAHHI